MGTTIFETVSRLAEAHRAINLGQGFPEEDGPREVLEEAARALTGGWNQYTTMWGTPALRQAIARHEARHWGLHRDWQSEVLVTAGAIEALAAAILAGCSAGDEVILLEPFYDAYLPLVRRAGATPVAVRLEPPGFRLDSAALARAVTKRTRMLVLNDPGNPTGRAFDDDELAAVATVAAEGELTVLCDSVYEHLVFGERRHRPLATLPGMAGRCLKVGSAGKIFSLTGWRIGWITGPAALLEPVARAHQFLTFCQPVALQAAVAAGLDRCGGWITSLAPSLEARRDQLAAGLGAAGLTPLPCQATYFLLASLAGTAWEGKDRELTEHLIHHAGVAAIPLSPFYLGPPERSLLRFCFAKKEATLEEAARRLARAGQVVGPPRG